MSAKRLFSYCIVALVAMGVSTRFVQADGPKGTAVIKGKVVFDGTPPATKPLPIKGDAHCEAEHKSPQPDQGTIVYKTEGNAVPYVFVYVKNGINGKYDVPTTPVTIDQHGCMYHPHVFGMMAGQPFEVKNSDPINHNIHSLAKKGNPTFNFSQPNKDMTKVLKGNETFTKPEVLLRIKCDVHSWMSAFVGVVTHPFYSVTKSHEDTQNKDERGTFEIKNLPAGEYEIEAVHEVFGAVTQKVSVKDGETKEITFKMTSKSAEAAPQIRTVELASTDGAAPAKCCHAKTEQPAKDATASK